MNEQTCFMAHKARTVNKAQSNATATSTPNALEAYVMVQLGARLLDILRVKGQTYYVFSDADWERVQPEFDKLKRHDPQEALRQIAERNKQNQVVQAQSQELTRRLKASVAQLIEGSR